MAANNIITLEDAKSFLRITDSSTDGELMGLVGTASNMIALKVGAVAGSPTFDEWYDGGWSQILLRHAPVQSVSSVTESIGGGSYYTLVANTLDGGTISTFGYTLDGPAGVVTRRSQGVTVPFMRGSLNVHVVYVGGYAVVPDDLKYATKLLVKHLWSPRRGGARRGQQQDVDPQDFDSMPRMVEEILDSYVLPGIG